MTQIISTKDSNEHLISIGEKLAAAQVERETAFISYRLEDGRLFHKGDWMPLLDASPGAIPTNTLQSIVDYLALNPDALELGKIIVHVDSPIYVSVRSALHGAHEQRDMFMRASAVLIDHMFNQRVSPDIFVPYLQSCFCPNEDLTALLEVAGNITDTTEVHIKDDGVSQEATLRSGAARKALAEVPSPAVLYPFSTFTEVMQPARKFVFRLGSGPLTCSLIEADGGAWKIAAIENISKWLRERLPEAVKVIA